MALYDPVKAHQYYLRTRHLKGRKGGTPTFTVRLNGRETVLTPQQLAEQKAYAVKRIGDIKKNLAELKDKLRKAMGNAKEKKAKSEKEAAKPNTAAEKSKAARASKQYQSKHQGEIAAKRKSQSSSKKKSTKKDSVVELETKITQIKSNLTAAVAKQRALTTATKNS